MTWNAAFGMRNAESRVSDGQPVRVVVTHPAFCLPPSALAVRSRVPRATGFTLVELLIVMAILAILAALLLGVAARAGERGREARTKAMIARLHTLVMEHYDTYKNRRAPLRDDLPALNNLKGQARAEARLYALRELMLLEMPDRWSDVLLASVDNVNSLADLNNVRPQYLKSPTTSSTYGGPTPLNEAYRRQYFAMLASGASKAAIKDNQGAECLYLTVMNATADGEARSLFNESSIGDTDGDGAMEFLDGWGNPISFIRWPAGYDSDLQLNARELGDPTTQPWLEQAAADHDPFDAFRVEQRAFRLVPLIFSAGGDERYDLFTARDTTIWPPASPMSGYYIATAKLSPYSPVTSTAGAFFLGTPMNEDGNQIDPTAGADNINNHSIASE